MLDPNRYSLDAATVGFRKRMRQSVNWGNFTEALQTQSESIKVRRELEETKVSEAHIMGGERYGFAGNSKTNELARQERQMNGYPLRSFYATGGAIVLPSKHGEGLMATPVNVGLTSYAQYNGVVGNYVSAFTEPLYAPHDSGVMLLARAGVQAQSESISNPYKFLQFQMNMNATQQQIAENERLHQELRGYNKAGDLRESLQEANAALAKKETMRQIMERNKKVMKEGVEEAHEGEMDDNTHRKAGGSVAIAGHLPNIHKVKTDKATLLHGRTGKKVADFEKGAKTKSEPKEPMTSSDKKNRTIFDLLEVMSREEARFMDDASRVSAQVGRVMRGGSKDEQEQLLYGIKSAMMNNVAPEYFAARVEERLAPQTAPAEPQVGLMISPIASDPMTLGASIVADTTGVGQIGTDPMSKVNGDATRAASTEITKRAQGEVKITKTGLELNNGFNISVPNPGSKQILVSKGSDAPLLGLSTPEKGPDGRTSMTPIMDPTGSGRTSMTPLQKEIALSRQAMGKAGPELMIGVEQTKEPTKSSRRTSIIPAPKTRSQTSGGL